MNAGGEPPCTLLEWDSAFFGLRIGGVRGDRVTPVEAARAVAWAQEHEIGCLYALIDAQHTPSIRALEQHNFILADVRLTLDREVDADDADSEHPVRSAEPADREPLLALARISHRHTRFAEDPRFDPSRSVELYATWISNAFEEPDALVLVPQRHERGSGYLTLHRTSEPEARIGLLAIADALQGGGLGEALVAEGLRRLERRGARRLSVVTQGRSSAAVRFYEKCGFKARSCQLWYHRWFER